MGALVNLWEQAGFGERGEPTGRAALLRLASALSATETEIERVRVGREKLASEMGKAADVERDLRERIAGEAKSLIAAMKQSTSWALGKCGSRGTLKSAETLSVSAIQTAIGDAALEEAAEELTRLESKRERLLVARAGIVKEVVRESLQDGLLADYGILLQHLQVTAARLRGLERYLTPPSHDYRPDAGRIALTVPNFARGDGSEQTIVAEAREVAKIEAHLAAFAASLEHDPRSPAPELPEFDPAPDTGLVYSDMTAPERAAVDREFVAITNRRRTVDSELFAAQVAEAKAFVGLTN
jgi:hypothetical protein